MTTLLTRPTLDAAIKPNPKPISNFEMFMAENCESLVKDRLHEIALTKDEEG